MTNYSGSEAYDFTLFEPTVRQSAQHTSTATVPEYEYDETPEQLEQQPSPTPSHPPKKHSARKINPIVKMLAAVLVVAVVLVAGSGILLGRRSAIDDIASEIADVKEQIKLEESDNVRYKNELNALFSKKEVEYYAENILGMVKLDSYNTIPISLPRTDQVVIFGGKKAESVVVNTESVLPERGAKDPAASDDAAAIADATELLNAQG